MIDVLKDCRVFKGCSSEELAAITKICERVTYDSGERIFEAGQPAAYLYIVTAGSVELRFKVTHYHAATEVALNREVQGNAFGWSALVEPFTYTLSAEVTQNSGLVRIKANDIKRLCTDNNHLGHTVMRNIAEIIGERFVAVRKVLIDLVQQNLIDKEV